MNIKYNKALWLIIILAIVMMIPFLGLIDFNTKGEPARSGGCLHHAGTWQLIFAHQQWEVISHTNRDFSTGASPSSASSSAM